MKQFEGRYYEGILDPTGYRLPKGWQLDATGRRIDRDAVEAARVARVAADILAAAGIRGKS